MRDKELDRIGEFRPDEDIASAIAGEKYGFIAGALAETMHKSETERQTMTHVLDSIVTNRMLGFPIFLTVMFLIFWATFSLGSYPMEWIEKGVEWLGALEIGRATRLNSSHL